MTSELAWSVCPYSGHCDSPLCVCVMSSSVEVFIRNKYVRKLYAVTGEQSKKPEQDKPKVGMNEWIRPHVREGGIDMCMCVVGGIHSCVFM